MPTRTVREDLLTSERYWKVAPEARNLYISILLSCDDTARYTGSNFALRTKCMAGSVDPERIERLLAELIDVDLVRAYEVDGARYIFVPRFRQRLRFTSSKYPEPPKGINDLTEKKTDSGRSRDGRKTDASPAQDGRSEEKRREVKEGATEVAPQLWTLALQVLGDAGLPERTARTMVGRMLRDHEEETVNAAFMDAAGKADPKAYVLGILKTKPKRGTKPAAPVKDWI